MAWTTSYVNSLRDFEKDAIRILASGVLAPEQLLELESLKEPARYDYTGSGYYLTIFDAKFPAERKTLSTPPIVGTVDDIVSGFILFLGEHKLVLECHSSSATLVPDDFRERNVVVAEPGPDTFRAI